jgi:methylaspartate mutase S subunit
MAFNIKNKRLADEEFFKKRKEVLQQWETGKQVENPNENIAAAKELSQGKSYALTLAEHKKKGANSFEPQFGQTLTEYMIEGISYVDADAILVSSMYGMGILDCEGFRNKCIEAGLRDIILYVGGTVAAPIELERNWPDIERRFQKIGFNRVFKNTCTASEAIAILKADLGIE